MAGRTPSLQRLPTLSNSAWKTLALNEALSLGEKAEVAAAQAYHNVITERIRSPELESVMKAEPNRRKKGQVNIESFDLLEQRLPSYRVVVQWWLGLPG